jgi:hypothetical protein
VQIGAEIVVEAPVAHAFAHQQHFQPVRAIGGTGDHGVERMQILQPGAPCAGGDIADPHHAVAPFREHVGATEHAAGPHRLDLDFRIISEGGTGQREAEIDRIAEILTGEAKPQADGPRAHRPLHRRPARPHVAADPLGTGP